MRRRRLLLIEDGAVPFGTVLNDCGLEADVIRCRPGDCGSFCTKPGPTTRLDLLVPVVLEAKDDWLGLFGELTRRPIRVPVLAILRETVTAEVLAAAARAADDFMLWSADRVAELRERINRLLGPADNTVSISEKLTQSVALAKLVGQDPTFLAEVAKIPILARSDGIVLILGETGTGKELCARAVHHLSGRRHMPFIPVDCAALPDHLLENELFGHVRGAFTDAHRDQTGLVAMAEGGTLFLDEVDSLTLAVQAKLLRMIEERTYKPLGADRFVQANIRIVAAANRSLYDLVRQKLFRADLFFRLNVLQLELPPLRQRRGDIAVLARHFAHQLSGAPSAHEKLLAPTAIEELSRAAWPGNVRELFNVIQRAVVFCEGPLILANHISLPGEPSANADVSRGFREAKERALQAFEKGYVEELLLKHNGNITRSALEAMKDRRAFARLMKKHRIDRRVLQSH
jgi:two-component system response regulator GlrR